MSTIKAEWTNADVLDLQPTCNQLATDTISRQAAIDAINEICDRCGEGKKYNGVMCGACYMDGAVDCIEALPPAEPEPCVNTIDALNESIKHFDDMAEECRRNANIERNDYMDMRDDAAEYRQLSIWLNELKWLRERFQSQPEIIRCKDCKWWAVIPNDDSELSDYRACYALKHCRTKAIDFCSRAERRTDNADVDT